MRTDDKLQFAKTIRTHVNKSSFTGIAAFVNISKVSREENFIAKINSLSGSTIHFKIVQQRILTSKMRNSVKIDQECEIYMEANQKRENCAKWRKFSLME